MPSHVKRTAEDKLESGPAAKKSKLDNNASQQQIKDRLAAKLDAPQDGNLSINRANLKNLSEDLTRDKIAEIRAKFISIRRTRIKPEDEDAKAPSLGSYLEVNREASTIFSRERQWRTRTTILQSTGKTFSKTITAILGSVKAREEGKIIKPPHQTPRGGIPGGPTMIPSHQQAQPRTLPNYNRYDQEQFHGKDDTHGFNIETTGTFSGMTLKSVTEGNANARNKAAQQSAREAAANNGITKSIPPSVASNNTPNSGGKRVSRTPIIIISAAPKSLITMYNAKEILQDLRYISTEEMKAKTGGMKRENELLIQRRKEGGLTVPYRVIDNPSKLTPADWDRVVAVFVMGQAWQFKGWPWDGNPTVIFSKICGFHLKWDEANLEKNIGNWAVNTIQLSHNKRHLDRACLQIFWEVLDK
jgi:parafibromin